MNFNNVGPSYQWHISPIYGLVAHPDVILLVWHNAHADDTVVVVPHSGELFGNHVSNGLD